MTNIDFGVAFFLLITGIVFAVASISSNMTNDFNYFNAEKVEAESVTIVSSLFDSKDNKSLISEFKMIQIRFDEIGMLAHSSNLDIEITPEVNKVHVYDKQFSEISSSITPLTGKIRVSFSLDFSAGETKYVNIFYEGTNTSDIEYTSNVTETNVTSVILSEREEYLLSQSKCTQLQSLGYQESKDLFGFTENFRIDNGCIYGPNPPDDANVIVKTIPMIIELSDEIIQSEKIRLMVW
jgi:hypothetical protein